MQRPGYGMGKPCGWAPTRKTAASCVRINDVNLDSRATVVRGKGNQVDVAHLNPQIADELAQLMEQLPHRQPADPISQRKDGTPRGVRWANAVFRRLARRAPSPKVSPNGTPTSGSG